MEQVRELELLRADRDALLSAAVAVLDSWERGDLAAAVRALAAAVGRVEGGE